MLVSPVWAKTISVFIRRKVERNQEIYFKIMIFVFQIMIAILSLLL